MEYLVIGTYDDDGQRWADSVKCDTPAQAEDIAPEGVTVAAVVALIDGVITVVA